MPSLPRVGHLRERVAFQRGAAVSSALTLSKGDATDGERWTRMACRKATSAGAEGMHASQLANVPELFHA